MRPSRFLVALLFFALCSGMAWADSPMGVTPFGGDAQPEVGDRKAGPGSAHLGVGPGIQAAADFIASDQCSGGGWCWPSGDGCCTTGSPYNTSAPIVTGLLNAYAITGDPTHLAAAELGAAWDMSSTYGNGEYRASTMSAYMLHYMTGATADPTYSAWAEVEFFDALTAGTYGQSDYTTHTWIGAVQTGRAGTWINLLPWEFMYLPYTASQIGNPDSAPGDNITQQSAFLAALLAGFDTLDSSDPYNVYCDLIGLAGGVYGLALNGTTTFPAINAPLSPMVDGTTTLCALANTLASYQNANGSWYWHSSLPTTDVTDEDTQTTAYAVLALIEAQAAGCGNFETEVAKARDWLRSVQNPDGSYQVYPGGYVNSEVNGEAVYVLNPDPCTDNKLVLEVPSASACVAQGEQVTVELWQRNLTQPVRGYQAWLQFDSLQMAFNSGTYTTTPFGLPVLAIAADGNNIDLAAGLTMSQSPTSADALLATLVFDTAGMPDGPTVVSFRDRQPPTRFTDETGQEVLPCLVASTTILIDGTDPVIACPANITIECTESTHPSNTGMATATDNLDDNPVVTWSDAENMTGCGGYTGTIIRTWTAEDCAGNTATCEQTVTVVDTTQPDIECPENDTIECDADSSPAGTGSATATDNCDPAPVITHLDSVAAGSCPQESVITRTWTATDACGNTDTCEQIITVVDDTPPVITPPSDATVECDADLSPASLDFATAADNCDPSPAVDWSDNTTGLNGCNGTGTLLRTWTATDACGNSSTHVQTITVQDLTAPVIAMMPDINVYADAGGCDALVTWTDPAVTDNCGGMALSFFDGFEDDPYVTGDPNWNEYDSVVTRVTSGTGGITSKSGAAHALLDSTGVTTSTGAFTRLGGYSSYYGEGFNTSLDVYIDLTDPAVGTETYGWDLTTAATRQSGSHLRDFIFHVADTNSGTVLVAGSNNSNGSRRNDLAGLNHYEITASGWYTFEWDFRDAGDGSLAVDLNLYDGGGVYLWTEIRNNPLDVIATEVGGNRYMWFTFLAVDTLAIDNTTMNKNDGDIDIVYTDPSDTVLDPTGTVFPVGTTTVTVTATDECGNWVESFFDVFVELETEMVVDIALDGAVNDPTTRCITFELWDCGVGGPPTIVEDEVDFSGTDPGVATHTLLVPCGNYTCVTARDTLHTLRRTATSLTVSGTQYVATFDPLIGGNLNDDEWVDILDFGVFNWQYGEVGGDTDCLDVYPHADIDGDSFVDSDDFSFIQINFLATHDPDCCGTPAPLDGSMPVLSISVADLIARGMGELAAGDLNNDGWLDQGDVVAFMQGARPNQLGVGGVNKPLMQFKR